MLSRVADNLYWLGRYLERAAFTNRALEVHAESGYYHSDAHMAARLDVLLRQLLHTAPEADAPESSDEAVIRSLAVDPDCRASVAHNVASARENARQIRDLITTAMWEQLNEVYLDVRREDYRDDWQAAAPDFHEAVRRGLYAFDGVTEATFDHGESWQFLRLGRHLERAVLLARFLAWHLDAFGAHDGGGHGYGTEWPGALKCWDGLESFTRLYSASFEPDGIVEFLLQEPGFPNSLSFSIARIRAALERIEATSGSGGQKAKQLSRAAGQLQATIDYATPEELLAPKPTEVLLELAERIEGLHGLVYDQYIGYPLETALVYG